MFYEVVLDEYNSSRKPAHVEETLKRYRDFDSASLFAMQFYSENKPKDFETIVSTNRYGDCCFIAEKTNKDGTTEEYMVEVREVEFDD